MILTIKRKIELSQEQINYYYKSINSYKKIYLYYNKFFNNKQNVYIYDYYKIDNELKYYDKFAIKHFIKKCENNEHSYLLSNGIYEVPNIDNNIYINLNLIYIYGFGNIKINNIKIEYGSKIYKVQIRIIKDVFYIYIYYYFFPKNDNKMNGKSIGLDYSIYDFYVDSNGSKGNFPDVNKYLYNISKLHKQLNVKVKESNNYFKVKNKINKLYNKIYNIKLDYLHQLSTKLVNEYDIICVETLELKNLSSNKYVDKLGNKHKFGKKIYLFSYNKFIDMLEYKAKIKNKKIIKINKYYPSSKICNNCGYINERTNDLSIRVLECPICGDIYDRDVNAAKNILREGINQLRSNKYDN